MTRLSRTTLVIALAAATLLLAVDLATIAEAAELKKPAPAPGADRHEPRANPPLSRPPAMPPRPSPPRSHPRFQKPSMKPRRRPKRQKSRPTKWSDAEIADAKARCAVILHRIHAVTIPHEPIKEGACGAPAPSRTRQHRAKSRGRALATCHRPLRSRRNARQLARERSAALGEEAPQVRDHQDRDDEFLLTAATLTAARRPASVSTASPTPSISAAS